MRAEVLLHTLKNRSRQEIFKIAGDGISACAGLVLWESLQYSVSSFYWAKMRVFISLTLVCIHVHVHVSCWGNEVLPTLKGSYISIFAWFSNIRVYRVLCSGEYITFYFDIQVRLHSRISITLESQHFELLYSNNFQWFAELNLSYLYCKPP